MAITEKIETFAVKTALGYLDKDPEKNLPKLMEWFDRFDRKGTLKMERDAVRKMIEDKDNNWYKLIMSLWKDIDPGVRNRLFENFIINGCLLGYQRQVENKEKYNCNIPWAILLDPTSACNLHCTGCWAAEYGNHMNLTYEGQQKIFRTYLITSIKLNVLSCWMKLIVWQENGYMVRLVLILRYPGAQHAYYSC